MDEVTNRLGSRVVLTGVLPRGPGANADADARSFVTPSPPGEATGYSYAPPAGAAPDNKYAQPGVFTACRRVKRRK